MRLAEMTVNIPAFIVGKAGEPLHPHVIGLVRAMAKIGYWPIDWGEDTGEYTELLFSYAEKHSEAEEQAEWWIKHSFDPFEE